MKLAGLKGVLKVIKKTGRPLKPLILKLDKYVGRAISKSLGLKTLENEKVEYNPEEKKIRMDEVVRQVRLPIPSEGELK